MVQVDITREMEQQNDELGNELKQYMIKTLKQEFEIFEEKQKKVYRDFEDKTIQGMESIERILVNQRNDAA